MRASRVLVASTAVWMLMSLSVAWAQGAPDKPGQVLVAGDPALTAEMVDHLGGFFEWALEAPLTQQQWAELRQSLIDSWQQKKEDDIKGMMQMLDLAKQVAQHPAAERDLLREQIQPQLLSTLRQNPNDQGSKWLLGIYDAAHKPIAEGVPPLTRQVADAYAEVLFFMVNQVMSNDLQVTPEFKDGFAKSLAASYAQYDAQARQQLAKMPIYWAAIRITWPTLSTEKQEAYRKQWEPGVVQLLRPLAPPASQAAASPAAALATGDELPLESNDLKGYLGRAAKYYEQGLWDHTIADCTQALQLDPKYAPAYVMRAKAADAQFHYRPAIEDLTHAIELDPKNWEAYAERSCAYYCDKQEDKGDADLAMMRQLKGESPGHAGTGDKTLDLMAKIQKQHDDYTMMSNMSMLSHEANMSIIHNLGSGWTYEYH